MGKYGELKTKAREIAEIGETGRLVLLAVERDEHKEDITEEEIEQLYEGCDQARSLVLQVMEEYDMVLQDTTKEEIAARPLNDFESCKQLGLDMRRYHDEFKKQANISRVFYPFFPTSISRLSVTTFEIIMIFVIGIGLLLLLEWLT